MRHAGKTLVLTIVVAVAAAASAGSPKGRNRAPVILDVHGDLAAIAGTSEGTVVLIYGVPPGDSPTAVRRREIGLDGATLSDVTTELPTGFAWSGRSPFLGYEWKSTSIDVDGAAALNAGTEIRLLRTDGTFSGPVVPSNPADGVLLRGGFLHIVEQIPASPFRTTIVWEGIRPDGTRVGPSAPLDPSAEIRVAADGQTPDAPEPYRIDAYTISFDGRPDGSAVVVVYMVLPPDPSPSNFSLFTAEWLYAIDAEGTARAVPGPEPFRIGGNSVQSLQSSRALAGPGVTTWHVSDIRDVGGKFTLVASNGLERSDVVGDPMFELSGPTCTGVTADGRLIALGLARTGDRRHDRIAWASFTAVDGGPPDAKRRLVSDTAQRRRFARFPGQSGFAAVAPDGASLFACPAAGAGVDIPDRLLATVIDRKGRAARRLRIPAPGYGSSRRDPRVVACGSDGFAIAWQELPGNGPAEGDVPTKLALIRRR